MMNFRSSRFVLCALATVAGVAAVPAMKARATTPPRARLFATQVRTAGTATSYAQYSGSGWNSPSATTTLDGVAAYHTNLVPGGNALILSNFGFSIPSGATITAVRVKNYVTREVGDGCLDGSQGTGVQMDADVNTTNGPVSNSLGFVTDCNDPFSEEGPKTFTFTSPNALPTAAQVNDSDFGVNVTAVVAPISSVYLDYLTLEVEYTL